jgi:4-hydroxy-3-polyprenylbenzoate decarboxylase
VDLFSDRYLIAITGASGATYGIRLLEVLRDLGVETHGIISSAGIVNLKIEKSFQPKDFASLCKVTYDERNVGAGPASGSFLMKGMVIVPCSMKTLACVAHGISDNLITRSADVCLKEKRKLVLVPRETPLSLVHLRNMVLAADAGAIILPAMPGFYHEPKDLHDLVDQVVGKILDALGIQHQLFRRWTDDRLT